MLLVYYIVPIIRIYLYSISLLHYSLTVQIVLHLDPNWTFDFGCVKIIDFSFSWGEGFGPHSVVLRVCSLLWVQGSFLAVLRGSHVPPGIKLGLATCRTSTIPPVPCLQPKLESILIFCCCFFEELGNQTWGVWLQNLHSSPLNHLLTLISAVNKPNTRLTFKSSRLEL